MSELAQIEKSTEEWSKKLLGKVIVPQSVLDKRADNQLGEHEVSESSLPTPYRLLPPGSITTRDYRIERLNVFTDSEKKELLLSPV